MGEPGGARGSSEESEGARRSQEKPEPARRSQEPRGSRGEPGGPEVPREPWPLASPRSS